MLIRIGYGLLSDTYTESRKNKRGRKPSVFLMVPEVGLEPTRLTAHDFESRSSANSDTLA